MSRYVLRRLGFMLVTLLLTSIIVFLVTQWLPGDIARIILGREAGQAAVDALRKKLGLDLPLPVQYYRWLRDFVMGRWGVSFSTQTSVFPLVISRLRNSLMLTGVALVMAIPTAIGLGVIAGLRRNTAIDNVISISALSVVGLPEFVTGLILIQIVALQFHLLPANSSIPPDASFFEAFPYLILPALTATLVLLAYVTRLTRAGVAEELKQTYVRTAVLKGLPRRTVVVKHVLRNALMPTITVIAISFGWLISGLVVVENVYNYPGVGSLLVFAIDRHDLPIIQAVSMVTVVGYASANLLADLFYAYLNPRIRLGR
jgi:peptide/nickel transport system permease protein